MRSRRDRIMNGSSWAIRPVANESVSPSFQRELALVSSGKIAVRLRRLSLIAASAFLGLSAVSAQTVTRAPVQTVAGMPPVVDAGNLYSEAGAGKLSPATAGALSRVYVPNVKSGDVYVIDPAKFEVVDHFQVGGNPQHIIPSWDLKTLWIAGSAERQLPGILTPIDPKTGKPGMHVTVTDAYNL